MHIYEEKFRRHLETFASELFTYYNINKGHFSFRKAYCVIAFIAITQCIAIIIQLVGNTLQ